MEYTRSIFFFFVVKFNDIRFQDILPPPPGITYITNGKSLELSWRAPILAQSVSGFAILFKTSNTKTAYDLLLANLQSSFAKLNVDTSKDYEVFVAVLNAEDEMPGYFQRISCKLKCGINVRLSWRQ